MQDPSYMRPPGDDVPDSERAFPRWMQRYDPFLWLEMDCSYYDAFRSRRLRGTGHPVRSFFYRLLNAGPVWRRTVAALLISPLIIASFSAMMLIFVTLILPLLVIYVFVRVYRRMFPRSYDGEHRLPWMGSQLLGDKFNRDAVRELWLTAGSGTELAICMYLESRETSLVAAIIAACTSFVLTVGLLVKGGSLLAPHAFLFALAAAFLSIQLFTWVLVAGISHARQQVLDAFVREFRKGLGWSSWWSEAVSDVKQLGRFALVSIVAIIYFAIIAAIVLAVLYMHENPTENWFFSYVHDYPFSVGAIPTFVLTGLLLMISRKRAARREVGLVSESLNYAGAHLDIALSLVTEDDMDYFRWLRWVNDEEFDPELQKCVEDWEAQKSMRDQAAEALRGGAFPEEGVGLKKPGDSAAKK